MFCRLCLNDISEKHLDTSANGSLQSSDQNAKDTPIWSVSTRPIWNYFQCPECHFLQMSPQDFISQADEYSRYLQHQNSDSSYQDYFEKFVDQIFALETFQTQIFLNKAKSFSVLDFGCGPYPMLANVLESKGFRVAKYDSYFVPEFPEGNFDLVFMHEVLEHIQNPNLFFDSISEFIKPNGYLIISTKFYPSRLDFDKWSYRRDPTHIGFYNEKVFRFIEKKWAARLLHLNDPIAIFEF